MRLTVVTLLLVLLSVSSWAGTFKDDFEDGNWQGWRIFGASKLAAVEAERFSIVDGVLRMDTRVAAQDTSGYEMGLNLAGDWTDYSFSADMRIVQVDPGH